MAEDGACTETGALLGVCLSPMYKTLRIATKLMGWLGFGSWLCIYSMTFHWFIGFRFN